MTAITLSAPRLSGGRSTARSAAPSAACTAGSAMQRPVAARSAAGTSTPMRLTRRGRLAITSLLAVAGIAVTLFTGSVGFAGTDVQHQPVRYVTVAPGQTLWAIAATVAPDEDRRDTVARILELNALTTSGVRAGQQIAVPAGG